MVELFFILILAAGAFLFFKKKSPEKTPKNSWPRPGMPQDFIPTHIHDNVALDGKTGRLWIRTESGEERVFDRFEITGWSVNHETTSNAYRVTWAWRVYLSIQTNDLDKPIWAARFIRHPEKRPQTKNMEECNEWLQRLTAVYNHGATATR